MVDEVKNNWPLVPMHTPVVTVLQKNSAFRFSLERRMNPVALENKPRHTPVYYWEKGAFVDVYA